MMTVYHTGFSEEEDVARERVEVEAKSYRKSQRKQHKVRECSSITSAGFAPTLNQQNQHEGRPSTPKLLM